MSAKFAELKAIVDAAQKDVEAFYDKGNKAAGTRIRKAMQDAKVLAQEIRLEVQAKKNDG